MCAEGKMPQHVSMLGSLVACGQWSRTQSKKPAHTQRNWAEWEWTEQLWLSEEKNNKIYSFWVHTDIQRRLIDSMLLRGFRRWWDLKSQHFNTTSSKNPYGSHSQKTEKVTCTLCFTTNNQTLIKSRCNPTSKSIRCGGRQQPCGTWGGGYGM